jgi:hypothetical protein
MITAFDHNDREDESLGFSENIPSRITVMHRGRTTYGPAQTTFEVPREQFEKVLDAYNVQRKKERPLEKSPRSGKPAPNEPGLDDL